MLSYPKKQIEKLHNELLYRPVGVAILYTISKSQYQFLLVQSAKDSNSWLFPQGGIDRGETAKKGLERELHEELGIRSHDLQFDLQFSFERELEHNPDKTATRGYLTGKHYFYFLGKYEGSYNFQLEPTEVQQAQWMNYRDAITHFYLGREEKAKLSHSALEKALNHLNTK